MLHGITDYMKRKSKSEEDNSATESYPNEDGQYTSDIPEMKEINSKDETAIKVSGQNGTSKKQTGEIKDDQIEVKQSFFKRIEPVAWLIIIGDAMHNFADGLALGATIVQSLTLGLSTMFALVFHELPHELGDYVILVKSGLHWGTALFFNFLSSLTAILGFFVGVAISSNSEEASSYILAMTAGLFLYISLTDLLPELIHGGNYNSSQTVVGDLF